MISKNSDADRVRSDRLQLLDLTLCCICINFTGIDEGIQYFEEKIVELVYLYCIRKQTFLCDKGVEESVVVDYWRKICNNNPVL